MDILTLAKLNKALIFALVDNDKIVESTTLFNAYYNNIKSLKVNRELKKQKDEELVNSVKEYTTRLFYKANEHFNKLQWTDAIICYQTILNYASESVNNLEFLKRYTKCLSKTKQISLTQSMLLEIIKFTNNDIEYYPWIAEIYDEIDCLDEASYFLEQYITAKNKDEVPAELYNLLGCYYSKNYAKTYEDPSVLYNATKYIKKAFEKDPYNKLYPQNLTIMTAQANNLAESKYYWDKVFEFGNLTENDKFEYSAFCLKTGDFKGWYDNYVARFTKTNPVTIPDIDVPLYTGKQNLSGKTLLIHCEQGFGDTILMWGYNKRLLEKISGVIWVVQDNIYPLLVHNEMGIKVYPESVTNLNNLKFDFYIPSMDIPKVLGVTKENACVGSDYISVNPDKVSYYKDLYFDNNRLKIGLAFSGSNDGNKTRNISIKYFEPFDKLKNVELYSLTKNVDDNEFSIFKNNRVNNVAKYFTNFDDTA